MEKTITEQKIEDILHQAEQLLPELPEVEFSQARESKNAPPATDRAKSSVLFRRQLGMLGDIQLEISIELGRASMYLEDVARLRQGSVVVLDRLAGEPVDVLVNGRVIARGELLVVDGNFSVRLTEFV
ncbi:MAG: flagellar motor switch protein FliN [Planctomycetia bacterium]|nr:flagellar motor switch protein FliN [Planctomycetia bacterium]